MDTLKQHMERGLLLHAYGIQGDWEKERETLNHLSTELFHMPLGVHPDTFSEFYELFGIDESRTLIEKALRRPQENRKCFVIGYGRITLEAQNALLKLFEEPPEATHFFIIIRNFAELLPTLRSRLFLIVAEAVDPEHSMAKSYVNSHPGKRIEILGTLLERKNPEEISQFLNAVEVLVHERATPPHTRSKELNEIMLVRHYLRDRGASHKILLEHLSVAL